MAVTEPGSTVVPPSGDLGRAMHVLMHDLRAPVSVTVGYLRLLRECRLPDEASRQLAIEHAIESLGRVSRLCDDASAYLAVYESPAPAAGDCPVDQIADAVQARLAVLDVPIDLERRIADRPRVAATSAEAMAGHLTCLVAYSKRHAPGAGVAVQLTWGEGWLRMLVGTVPQRTLLESAAPTPLDAWKGGAGFGPAAACLDVERHGGRVWTARGAWPGLGVALPLRAEAS